MKRGKVMFEGAVFDFPATRWYKIASMAGSEPWRSVRGADELSVCGGREDVTIGDGAWTVVSILAPQWYGDLGWG